MAYWEVERNGKPECYNPEKDAVYPLCIGNGSDKCLDCCLYKDYPDSFYADLES